jgi:hypothetical protein
VTHKRPPVLSLVLGIGVIAGAGYAFFRVVMFTANTLAAPSSDAGKAIVTAGATVFASVASLVLGKAWEQRTKLREEVRSRKIPVYEDMIKLLFTFLFAEKEGRKQLNEQEINAAFHGITEKIIVWGGPEVIQAWARFRAPDPSEPGAFFIAFEDFVKAIRKELGNSNAPLGHGDLLKLFVNDFDPVKAATMTFPNNGAERSPRSS